MKHVLILSAVIAFSTVSAASAQETGSGTLTQSGSVISDTGSTLPTTRDMVDTVRALIPERNPDSLNDILVTENKQKAWDNESAAARARLAQHRRDCREAVRRANRDQLMDRLLSCYRSDLLQDVNILRKQSQYLSAIPLLDPTIKAGATGAILRLIDAQMTIVNAIDTGLFEREDSLVEARNNLRRTYREPYWLSMTRVRADWQLTYISFMLENIEERLDETGHAATANDLLQEAATCLETGTRTLLAARTANDRSAATMLLTDARGQLDGCREIIRSIIRKERQ